MAHGTLLTGGVSESIAHAILLQHGFSVSTSIVPEVYDLIVTGKEDGQTVHFTVQVKTIKIRTDREGQIVVKGADVKGRPYSKDEVDYIFGIHLESNTGYLIPNNEQVEYWAKDFETARTKWTELKLGR